MSSNRHKYTEDEEKSDYLQRKRTSDHKNDKNTPQYVPIKSEIPEGIKFDQSFKRTNNPLHKHDLEDIERCKMRDEGYINYYVRKAKETLFGGSIVGNAFGKQGKQHPGESSIADAVFKPRGSPSERRRASISSQPGDPGAAVINIKITPKDDKKPT